MGYIVKAPHAPVHKCRLPKSEVKGLTGYISLITLAPPVGTVWRCDKCKALYVSEYMFKTTKEGTTWRKANWLERRRYRYDLV